MPKRFCCHERISASKAESMPENINVGRRQITGAGEQSKKLEGV
jgi:hypothetical protein